MPNELCDLKVLSRVAMGKAQAKARELRQANIPVPSVIFGELIKEGWREAREECSPVMVDLTPEQEKVVAAVCPPCKAHYEALKQKLLERKAAQAKLPVEGQPAAES